MKFGIPSIFLVASVVSIGIGVDGFQPTKTKVTRCTELNGWFDFEPVHGGGSGGDQSAIDEQWEAQQAILRARQGVTDKKVLKSKYKDPSKVPVSSAFAGKSSGSKTPASKSAAPKKSGFKMPWEK